MYRYPLLAISLLALVGCQASSPAPRLVGEDLFDVEFHGRVFTERSPMLSSRRNVEAAPTSECSAEESGVDVRLQIFSVARERIAEVLALKYEPASRAAAGTLAQIGIVNFFFKEQALPIDALAWTPRGMRVPREAARRAIAHLQFPRDANAANLRLAPTLELRGRSSERSAGSVLKQTSYIDRFEFQNDRNTLRWEPIIEVADSGVVVEMQPEVTDDAVHLELVVKARQLLSMPAAGSRVVQSWPHGVDAAMQPVTLQAPLFSEQVFELSREFLREDAFLLFAPNTVREGEVLVAYFEIDS